MMRISTHVLDTALGLPAGGVVVHLEQAESTGAWRAIATTITDADGRCTNLLPPSGSPAVPGQYRLRFETASYYTAHSVKGLYPIVEITVIAREGDTHLHVPLLLSPNGYTTYRGS